MRRFLKTQVLEKKYGSDLANMKQGLKFQLTDKDTVIGDNMGKTLKNYHLINKEILCLESAHTLVLHLVICNKSYIE